MMKTNPKNNSYACPHTIRAFTLIELLIYLAVAGVILMVIVTLYLSLQRAQQKAQSIRAVETQGAEALSLITQDIRNAQSITSPAYGTSASSISFLTYASSTSPTVISLTNSAISITEGAAAATPLTNSKVIVSGLSFQNIGVATTSGSIRIRFTMSYASSTNLYQTNYSKLFFGTATLHKIVQLY